MSKPRSRRLKRLTKLGLITLLVAILLRLFVVQAFKIPTASMEDTLWVGDFILVNKLIYGARAPNRLPLLGLQLPVFSLPAFDDPETGDIVVFHSPKDPSTDFVKRCVATGGQTVEIIDKVVYVDGRQLKEAANLDNIKFEDPYVIPKSDQDINIYPNKTMGNKDNYGPIVVDPDQYFVMGDNRDNSSDSRFWGFVPRDHLVGKAFLIYWSVSPEGFLDVRWSRIGNFIQ